MEADNSLQQLERESRQSQQDEVDDGVAYSSSSWSPPTSLQQFELGPRLQNLFVPTTTQLFTLPPEGSERVIRCIARHIELNLDV